MKPQKVEIGSEMTREKRQELAASIAKKLEDATKEMKSPEDEQLAVLGLVVTFIWPYGGAARLIWQALDQR